ncbi:hypothetical protein LSAT2_025530 [Lamellibrachia satsuma]|nr:hypothetical protein LSAT2_025530 [Lamellibrachia satsuma]
MESFNISSLSWSSGIQASHNLSAYNILICSSVRVTALQVSVSMPSFNSPNTGKCLTLSNGVITFWCRQRSGRTCHHDFCTIILNLSKHRSESVPTSICRYDNFVHRVKQCHTWTVDDIEFDFAERAISIFKSNEMVVCTSLTIWLRSWGQTSRKIPRDPETI